MNLDDLLTMKSLSPAEQIVQWAKMNDVEFTVEVDIEHLDKYLYHKAHEMYKEKKMKTQSIAPSPAIVLGWFRHYLDEGRDAIDEEMKTEEDKINEQVKKLQLECDELNKSAILEEHYVDRKTLTIKTREINSKPKEVEKLEEDKGVEQLGLFG